MKRVLVWDLPTRVCHWLLVLACAAAYVSGETGGNWLIWHGRIGLLIVGLITFRLVWGFTGSTHARFRNFVRGPAAIRDYLAGNWRGLGHNPLGALSVIGLLAALALQVGSGLGARNDDTGHAGPLHPLLGNAVGELLTRLHHQAFDVLLILVVLHVLAVLFYTHVRKDNLVQPMLTGHKDVSTGESARGGGLPAFIVALLIAGAVTWGAASTWIDQPAPPPPTAVPAW